jgi:hypothetical protein
MLQNVKPILFIYVCFIYIYIYIYLSVCVCMSMNACALMHTQITQRTIKVESDKRGLKSRVTDAQQF